MFKSNKFYGLGLALAILQTNCAPPQGTQLVGKVQDCDNGEYFSRQKLSCVALPGYNSQQDEYGLTRLSLNNGITVPAKINGHSPFVVKVAYDVTKISNFEVSLRRVDESQVAEEALTDTQKFKVEVGRGERSVILHPLQNIEPGPAASYSDGQWILNRGYVIEVKGGDRFEDEDADNYRTWRVAGVQVSSKQADDLAAKQLIVGPIEAPEQIQGCEDLQIPVMIEKTSRELTVNLELKKPYDNWRTYGGQTQRIPPGFKGRLLFAFKAMDTEGNCAPPGPKAEPDSSGQVEIDSYQFQLDILDEKQRKIDHSNVDIALAEAFQAVAVRPRESESSPLDPDLGSKPLEAR